MKVKKPDISDRMREFAVEADSAEDFIRRYHTRNEMYLENFDILVDGSKKDVEKWGYDILPAHISVTGELVSFFPKNKTEGRRRRSPLS
jgi:hypothetical protein